MAKQKIYYFYNPQTLNYDRVYPSVKERIWTIVKQIVLSVLLGTLVIGGLSFFIDSPSETLLRNENKHLLSQYNLLNRQLNEATGVLQDIQDRDDNLYRALFMADPIAVGNRVSDTKSSNRYHDFATLSNANLIISSSEKMDALARKLYIQSKSFDDLIEIAKTQEERLQCIPAIQPILNRDMKRISSGYGMRIDPVYRQPRFHAGIDFNAGTGTDVYVTGDGTVTFAGWRQGYGNTVVVNHGFGYQTLYGHLDRHNVRVGQKVTRGEVIGKVGNTGKSVGPHLHYEVLVRGVNDNPVKYFFMDLTPEEYDQMIRMAENRGQVMD